MIAFFDMDGTVLRIDTGTSWMRFLYRRGELSRVGLARALYWAGLYKLALLDLESLARRLTAELAGASVSEMIAKCEIWYAADVRHQVAPAAIAAIERHRARGDTVVMLTGSTQFAAEVVGASLGMARTLCSRLETDGDVFTGRLAEMCFGAHKVALAERLARELRSPLGDCAFYSDSYNDLPMLSAVGQPVAVNPDLRLRHHAARAGWRIENWAGS